MGNSNYFLDVMLNETGECIVFVDKKGNIEELSDAYAKFMGVNREDVIGKPVEEVIENTRLPEVIKSRKAELAQALEAEYGIDPETALADTRAFLDQMRTMGILIED